MKRSKGIKVVVRHVPFLMSRILDPLMALVPVGAPSWHVRMRVFRVGQPVAIVPAMQPMCVHSVILPETLTDRGEEAPSSTILVLALSPQ